MSRIKILYGVEAAEGGVLKHLLYLIANLNKNKFDVTVVLSDLRSNIDEEIDFMKFHKVNVIKIPMERKISPIRDVIAFVEILHVLRKMKYDVVHAHSSKAGALFCVAAWLYRVPKIFYTPHCFFFQSLKGPKKLIFILLERIIGRFYSGVIVSDNEKKEALIHKVAPALRVQNINNAIDFDAYRQCDKNKELRTYFGIDESDWIVGAIGRLTLQKGWYTYIYAAREIIASQPNVKFLIVGDGELKAEIVRLIYELNIQHSIILTGYIKEIYKIYSILDVFVNTSEWEGLPYVFLEAMYYKLPIVATDTGNDAAIINGKTGYIAEAKDYEAVALCIKKLIGNNRACAKMGVDALGHLKEKYSFKVFINLHEKLYSHTHEVCL